MAQGEWPWSGRASSIGDVGERVRQVVAVRLAKGSGYPDVQFVAAKMKMSVRSLQRRLTAKGLTYAGIVQQTRCAAARRMLKERGTIGDVARLLGYSDPAHFTRAFQRWAGMTPSDFRRRS